MEEVQLINILNYNLANQFPPPGGGPVVVPPFVSLASLVLRANKPDHDWVVGEVAQSQMRLPGAGLNTAGISLQRGTFQGVNPVTGVAAAPRDPVTVNAANAAARVTATATTRVGEIFTTLTRDEQPVAVGTPATAVTNDMRTFTLYVHYYLARMTVSGSYQNWRISRENTRLVESQANKVLVGANVRGTADTWLAVQAVLNADTFDTMHYVLVIRSRRPKYHAEYLYMFDDSTMPGGIYANPPTLNPLATTWNLMTVTAAGGLNPLPIDQARWHNMTRHGDFIEVYAIDPMPHMNIPPGQEPDPKGPGGNSRLDGAVDLGPGLGALGGWQGAMPANFVNPADATGLRVRTDRRPPDAQDRNAPLMRAPRPQRSIRQVFRQGLAQGSFGTVDTTPGLDTQPGLGLPIRNALTRAGDFTRDTKQRRRNKMDLMRCGCPSAAYPDRDPNVHKVKSCGPGSKTRAYTFLIDDNICL